METDQKETINVERLNRLFGENFDRITRYDTPVTAEMRKEALQRFSGTGFPDTKQEEWRFTDLRESLGKGYDYSFEPGSVPDIQKVFKCNIPHLDTAVIAQFNGWYVSKDVPLMELGNGIIMGSLAEAMKKYPALVEQYLGRYETPRKDPFTSLNEAFAQDGIFIYVPDNTTSQKAVQMVNVINSSENIFLQSRNLIILGKNSKLTLVHCDDSYDHQASFSNIVTEVYMGENAKMDHYKLQNLNNNSTLINAVNYVLHEYSDLESHFISFNGGLIRNNIRILFDGREGNANVNGLYLMDRKQHVDNQVSIDHKAPACTSTTLFKGILDESASGVFSGYVLVRQDAMKTNAYQRNQNILMTDTAKVNSKPFLEIYADDVKCSHGSTTGQLDSEALFYLRQRGIGEESARMLLMFAFANEVVGRISLPPLRQRIEDMVKKRLQGELQICEQCVLHCSTPEHPADFKIDLSKI